MSDNTDGLCINITSEKHKINYPSEWDPRGHANTKGGYLEGEITLPRHNGKMRMIIQTHPADQGKEMDKAREYGIHPTLVHVVRIGHGKRDAWKEPTPTEDHWKQEFLIEGKSVKILNKISEFESEEIMKYIPAVDEVTQLTHDRKIILGKKKQQLNLIVLQPTQKESGPKESSQLMGATIAKVIKNRLDFLKKEASVKELESKFKGPFARNIKQVKLCVEVWDESNNLLAKSYSKTISDYTDVNLGPLELLESAPLKGCTRGSGNVIMISDKKLPKDIEPFFETWNDKEGWVADDPLLKQPNSFKIGSGNWISFTLPSQQNGITQQKLKVGVRCLGEEDKRTSNFFNFKYFQHEEDCNFCDCSNTVMEKVMTGKRRKPPKETKATIDDTPKNLTKKKPQAGGIEDIWGPSFPDLSQNDLDVVLMHQDTAMEKASTGKRRKPPQETKTRIDETPKNLTKKKPKRGEIEDIWGPSFPDLSQNDLDVVLMNQDKVMEKLPTGIKRKLPQERETSIAKTPNIFKEMKPQRESPDLSQNYQRIILMGQHEIESIVMPPPIYLPAFVTLQPQDVSTMSQDQNDYNLMPASVTYSIQEIPNNAY